MSELSTVPGYELDSFFRKLNKLVDAFYKDPVNDKRFKEWERQENKKNDTM